MSSWLVDSRRRGLLLAGGLAAATLLSFLGFLRPLIEPLTGPIGAASSALRRLGTSASDVFFDKDLTVPIADGSDYPKTIERLREENAKLKTLVAENEALKAALGYEERHSNDMMLARVIFETDGDVLHGLVVDRGSSDGIAEGMPVVVGEGVMIGKIFEVRKRSATVMLLSDSQSRLAVSVQNGVDTVGVLKGDRGLSMRIDLIPQTETIRVGDTVVTSGVEPGVTRGLLVGTVERMDSSDEKSFQSAVVTPFSAHYRPSFVQVAVGWDDNTPDFPEAVDSEGNDIGL